MPFLDHFWQFVKGKGLLAFWAKIQKKRRSFPFFLNKKCCDFWYWGTGPAGPAPVPSCEQKFCNSELFWLLKNHTDLLWLLKNHPELLWLLKNHTERLWLLRNQWGLGGRGGSREAKSPPWHDTCALPRPTGSGRCLGVTRGAGYLGSPIAFAVDGVLPFTLIT